MFRNLNAVIVVIAALASLAACGSGNKPAKGGGAKGTAAKTSGQKAGGHAEADRAKGTSSGATYEEVACDGTTEGLAWCDSDTSLALCAGGEWFVLDCSSAEIAGDFCADDGTNVDCYASDEL